MFQYNAPAATYGAAYADVVFLTNSPINGATQSIIKLPPFSTSIAVHVVNPHAEGLTVTIYGSNDGVNFDAVVAEYTVLTATNKIQSLANVAYSYLKVAAKRAAASDNTTSTISVRVVPNTGS